MTVSTIGPASRTQADRCPGLLRPHRAADGALVRLRVPGGAISPQNLIRLGEAAVEFGDGNVQITSRANLQLRGVAVGRDGEVSDGLVAAVQAAGLLPSATHELVRNIACSPLTGRIGGRADLRGLTAELDRSLCAKADLAELPGRFQFGLDDGRGDILGAAPDLGVLAVSADRVRLTAAGVLGPVEDVDRAAGRLIELARGFQRRRGAGPTAVWHVHELSGGGADLLAAEPGASPFPRPEPLLYGSFDQIDGRRLLSLAVPLGLLSMDRIAAVAAAAASSVIVTAARGMLLPDLERDPDAETLTAFGLSVDPDSGWQGVTACAGAPGCGRAMAPTTDLAARLASVPHVPGALPVHVVACPRRCGAPGGRHVEVLAGPGHLTVIEAATGLSVELSDRSALVDTVTLSRNGQ